MGLFALDDNVAWSEVIEKRTQRSRTYFDDETGQYRLVAGMTTLQDESGAEIDATPHRFTQGGWDGWRVDLGDWTYGVGKVPGHASDGWMVFAQGPYNLKTRLARVGYLHWPTRAWQDVGGAPTYDRNNLSATPQAITVGPNDDDVTVGSHATWENIWQTPGGGALDIHWRIDGQRIKEEIVITETAVSWIKTNRPPATPPTETWFGFIFEVDADAVPQVVIDGLVSELQDEAPEQPIELRDTSGEVIATLPLDRAWSTGDVEEQIDLQKRIYTENGHVYLLVGARVDLLGELSAGDVVFDPTINLGVATGTDDATGAVSSFRYGFDVDNTTIETHRDDTNAFFRIGGIAVEQGSSVSAGVIDLTATKTSDSMTLAMEDGLNPATYQAGSQSKSARPDTDIGTIPSATTGQTVQVDIASAINARVNDAGWVSGNAMAFRVHRINTFDSAEYAAYEHALFDPAKLTITYSPPNTAPEISSVSTSYPAGRTRIGPESGDATVKFTAADAEQTGTDELNWAIWTGSGGTGTQVASGTATSGVEESVSIAYNASGLSQGSNTLYILVDDGTASDEASTTVLVDSSAPTIGTITQSPSTTTDHDYALSFTASDTYSTDTGELSWEIRTASGGGGTLLDSGTATSGVEVNTGTITDAGLVHGANTRWLYFTDGAGNVLDQSFSVETNYATTFSVQFSGTSSMDVTLTSPAHFSTSLDGSSDMDVALTSPTMMDVTLAGASALDIALASITEFEVALAGASDLDVSLVNFEVSAWHRPPLMIRTLTQPTRARTLNIQPTRARTITGDSSAELFDDED